MNKSCCTVSRASPVLIHVSDLDGMNRCMLRFEEDSGWVSISSSYGDWTHHWPPRNRTKSLARFLAGLNIGYAGRKFLGSRALVYSPEKTVRHVRWHILQRRREGSLSKSEAREEWARIELLEEFKEFWCSETHFIDASELFCREIDPEWRDFWEQIWTPLLVPILTKWPEAQDDAREFESTLEDKETDMTKDRRESETEGSIMREASDAYCRPGGFLSLTEPARIYVCRESGEENEGGIPYSDLCDLADLEPPVIRSHLRELRYLVSVLEDALGEGVVSIDDDVPDLFVSVRFETA